MKHSLLSVLLSLNGLLLIAAVARADNWPQWRGPALNGSSHEINLPDKLDPTTNLLWSADLPGHGAGTPIVWNDRVFISSLEKGSFKLRAMCFDRKTGSLLWNKEVAIGFSSPGMNDMASPSPITDGQRVFFFYGTGDLAAFDMDGKPLWARNIQKDHGNFNVQFLYGASPLLYKGKLYIPVLHREQPYGGKRLEKPSDSYLLAVDANTGKDLWKHIRPTDAHDESKESYATPMPYEGSGRSEIILVGGDCATGHDPETGKEFWRCGGWNPTRIGHWRLVPSALVADNLFIICTPKVKGCVFAIRAGGNGDVVNTHIAWKNTELASDVCVPLHYQGKLYVLDGDFKKGLSCLDLKTGQRQWFTPLRTGAVIRTSPAGADGKIYLMDERGEAYVLSAADGKILSKTLLGSEGTTRASIAAAQGCVLVRTGAKLYVFANKAQ
ncbi:MAG TPA: PQQ-binding-like beta-propeller repeat protein [Tepidisphaeraceae bacterium]|nr:PQQ-binding-like beta-propeller repeat protein [Tepidisphaeraceae bacterium]